MEAGSTAGVELMVAARYLGGARGGARLSVSAVASLVGIAVGVAALILVLAVMTGLRDDQLNRIMGVDGHITVMAGPRGLTGYEVDSWCAEPSRGRARGSRR